MKRFLLPALVCLLSLTAAAQPTDLLISEYVEGSSFNKAIELYNGTGAPIDLSAYTLELYSNGNTSPNASLTLSGMLADGGVYVLAHPSADAAILAVADVTSGGVINFNGDDALVLRKGGAVVDAFGQVGVDPGSSWGTPSTQNNTLRRLATDCMGDTDETDAFDPSARYDGFGNDVFDGLGAHSVTCGGGGNTPPVFTSVLTDQTIVAGAPFSFTYDATDADPGDVLAFTLDAGPAGATLDASSGVFDWTPAAADAGMAFTVAVSVSDGTASDGTTAVLTVSSPGSATGDLLISEYVEGSSFNKAMELFNSTGGAIDLSAYTLDRYSNGSPTTSQSFALSGSLAAGDVYVIAHPSADPAILAVADVTSGVVNFNGDDAMVLHKGAAVADAFGQVGFDPGSAWGPPSTANNTLRRLAGDCTADTDPNDVFDPGEHYAGFGTDVFGDLGSHTATCGGGSGNAAPAFTAVLPDTLVDGGSAISFTFAATDADSDPLTFALVDGPAGASIDGSGHFNWTAAGTPDVYTVRASVTDGSVTTTATTYVGVRGTLFAGEDGATLRQSIRDGYTPDLTLGYDVARDTLYLKIDRDAGDIVHGVYTGFGVALPDGVDPSSYLATNGINAEHTWPQSMGAADEPGRSDMHNLFPAKDNVNSARSNKPYADIPDDQTDTWYRLDMSQTTIPTMDIDLWAESASGFFEPRELHKGNAARAGTYFFTIYEAVSNASFLLEQRQTFIDWNSLDPTDGHEIRRTGQIAERQGNVNPYLLDPTLVARAVSDIMPPPVTTIADARGQVDGTLVTVEGVVTRAGGRFTRLQDATAGLTTFQSAGALRAAVEAGDVASGDLLRVTGTMDTFNGLSELVPSLFEVVSRGNALPAVQTVTLAEVAADGEDYESELIRVVGLQIDPAGDAAFQPSTTYDVHDASAAAGVVALRTPADGEGTINGQAFPPALFAFEGVLGQFLTTYQLQPIDAGDVQADASPPTINARDGGAVLWSPNHKYHTFSTADLVASVVDDQDGEIPVASVVIAQVTSDEPEDAEGDGNTLDDIVIGDDCRSVDLRAERQGGGDGRVYTIYLTVSDASGNADTLMYPVAAPEAPSSGAVDSGTQYVVEGACDVPPAAAVRDAGASPAQMMSVEAGDAEAKPLPAAFALSPAYPNPFNPEAHFTLDVDASQPVRVEVFDVAGRRVALLHDDPLAAGRYDFTFDAKALPSGTYLIRAAGARTTQHQLVTLVK